MTKPEWTMGLEKISTEELAHVIDATIAASTLLKLASKISEGQLGLGWMTRRRKATKKPRPLAATS
jgi:hypothetical protein